MNYKDILSGYGKISVKYRMTANNLFCGQPSTTIRHILGIVPPGHYTNNWFGTVDVHSFHKARIGIRHASDLLRLNKEDEILAPAYHCGSEIDPLLNSGVQVTLYDVDQNCRINIPDIKNRITSKTKAIYVTHYFGFPQDLTAVKKLCEQKKLYLIEDCAMALFSCDCAKNIGRTGDIAVFSLVKTLPVPDGGWLVINNPSLDKLSIETELPALPAILRRLMPFIKSNLLIFLSKSTMLHPLYAIIFKCLNFRRMANAEKEISAGDKSPMSADLYYHDKLSKTTMSGITKRMLKAFVPDEIKRIRRRNYCQLADLLRGQNNVKILFTELPAGVCPLNFPVIVNNRDIVRLELYKRGIDADAFGKYYHHQYTLDDFPDSRFLRSHLLSLPIHQNLDARHIQYIADNLIEVLGDLKA